jgi:Flp pilus assembly protein TadD
MKNHILLMLGLGACLYSNAQQTDSSGYYLKKGLEEKTARRFLVAAGHFTKAAQLNPQSKEALLENAWVHQEMRKTDQAMQLYEQVMRLDPANPTAIRELTLLYYAYRKYDKVIQYAQKCGGCPELDRLVALSHYQQENYGEAIKWLKKLLNMHPNDAELQYTLGRTYLDMEDYKNAFPPYAKAIELDQTKNVWMYELGMLSYTLNDYKNANKYFSLAGEKGYPKNNDYLENLGFACMYSGDIARGEEYLEMVVAKKPHAKDLLRDIAQVLYQQKQYDKSLAYCQKLMELDMNDAKALYQAGMCFQKKGEKDRGQQMCDKAIEMDPSLASMRQKSMSAGL